MWGCYVTVKNVDETLTAVRHLGGGVLMEPMEVKGVGRMAVIRDPQGRCCRSSSTACDRMCGRDDPRPVSLPRRR